MARMTVEFPNGRVKEVPAKVGAVLLTLGRAVAREAPKPPKARKPRKGTYKRRDLTAES